MGKNVSTAPVSFRLPHPDIAALKKIAEDRDITVNAMLGAMVQARIREIASSEGWWATTTQDAQ
jgi:hypothetical protein